MDTSASLLDRLRDRADGNAWQRLVDLYTPLIRRWLRRGQLQPADADDLTQEVLAVVVRELPRFQHNQRPGAFRKWLREITRRRLNEFWRAQQQTPPRAAEVLSQLADPASGLSQLWDREHDRHVIERLLQLIQHDFAASTWRAFHRLVLEGGRPEAVAEELGVTVNSLYVAKSKVLQRLRDEASGLVG